MEREVFVFDDIGCDFHETGTLPEKGSRIEFIRTVLKDFRIESIEPIQLDNPVLNIVHAPQYVKQIKGLCKEEKYRIITNDVVVCGELSFKAICLAANSGIMAIDAILSNQTDKCFCNVRPPGHHAKWGKASGFCIFNNIAIAAQHALMKDQRVVIVDWDVHHGNGTEDFAFRMDKEIAKRFMFINTQQQGIYPGTGESRIAYGPHKNVYSYNLNAGEGDMEMKLIFELFIPILIDFKPDIILVSCGFDAHELDEMSEVNLTSEMYGWMTRELLKVCPKMVSMLEGGYNDIALINSVKEHLKAMK